MAITTFKLRNNLIGMKRLLMSGITVFLFSSFFLSCYYDSEEALYPSFGCDSTNITYKSAIALTMDNYCTSCHGGSAPQGSISLTNYADVVHYASQITPAIKHTGLYPMPKNAGK
jgi:hypothetical protein